MINDRIKPALLDVAMVVRFVIGCGCLLAAWSSDSRAASVTVPLDFEVVETVDGAEVVAAFDFGVKFTEIESVTFSFLMEEGYEGTFATTGNSSFSRDLLMELSDETGLPAHGCTGICMQQSLGYVPAGELTSYRLWPGILFVLDPTGAGDPDVAGGIPTIPGVINFLDVLTYNPDANRTRLWPEVVRSGVGQLAVADFSIFARHLLPTGAFATVSATRMAPEITMATLTITGTLVPEPSGVVCGVVLVGLGVVRCRRARGEMARRGSYVLSGREHPSYAK